MEKEDSCMLVSNESLDAFIAELRKNYVIANRVLLINPPQFNIETFDINVAKSRGYYAYPPTGLLFLAAALEKTNTQVEIIDLNYEVLYEIQSSMDENIEINDVWKTILKNRITKFEPGIIGVACMFTSMRKSFESVLKYVCEESQAIVLAGGTHVSFEFESLLKQNLCHLAIAQEGEGKVPFIINKLLVENDKTEEFSGIYYKDGNGNIVESHGNPEFPNINYNINHSYELIPIQKYCEVGSLNQYSRAIGEYQAFSAVSMNRGCRGRCTFCSVHSLIGDKVRSRDINLVIDELRYLATSRGITHFDWLDDDLLANRNDCMKLFQKMIDEKLNLHWYANNGVIATCLDEKLLDLMVRSGCKGFKIGIESGNEKMIKFIRKPTSLSKLLEISVLLQKFPSLFVAGNYIIGFPDETFLQMLDTFKFANKMNIDWSGYYICQPMKGAEVFDAFDKLGDERCKEQKIDNYLPAHALAKRNNKDKKSMLQGLEIFKINKEHTVDEDQLKEIWFVFGFITNFINNKNLKPNGNVDKFIDWVIAAMQAYPADAGMALFLSFAFTIKGNKENATLYFNKATEIYEESIYWQERFQQFYLVDAITKQLESADQVYTLLTWINKEKISWVSHV